MAAFLAASLLPVTFATAVQAAQHTNAFADWVRGQLRVPADATVEAALAEAEAARATSLEAFLHAFVEAYEASPLAQPLADVFGAPARSNQALITYLASRYQGLVADAVPPRTSWVAAGPAQAISPERAASSHGLVADRAAAMLPRAGCVVQAEAPALVLAVRGLVGAQPRGP